MNDTKLISVGLCIVFFIAPIGMDSTENGDRPLVSVNREEIERQSMAAYRSACTRLQDLADWMAIVLRLKSFWTRSISRRKHSRLSNIRTVENVMDASLSEKNIDSTLFDDMSKRSKRDTSSELQSCASLKNLHSSAQTYVQWQAELMKIKAMLGGNLMRAGVTRLDNSADALKILRDRMQKSDIVNRTSSELLESLKLGSRGLVMQLQDERERATKLIREIGQSGEFTQSLYAMKDGILTQLQKLVDTSEGLKRAQLFLKKGDLLQVLSSALDKQMQISAQDDPLVTLPSDEEIPFPTVEL